MKQNEKKKNGGRIKRAKTGTTTRRWLTSSLLIIVDKERPRGSDSWNESTPNNMETKNEMREREREREGDRAGRLVFISIDVDLLIMERYLTTDAPRASFSSASSRSSLLLGRLAFPWPCHGRVLADPNENENLVK